MDEMTLDEARRIGRQFNDCASMPTEKVQEAFRVMDAALPKPPRRTPGQVAMIAYSMAPDQDSIEKVMERVADTVLKAFAVQPEDLELELLKRFPGTAKYDDMMVSLNVVLAAFRSVAERKGQ